MPISSALLDNEFLRKFFSGRRRFQLGWVFSVLLVLQAKTYPNLIGIGICAIGALLRVYASGFLRKEDKLTVGGPYAYTRNPLYLGTLIMALGATISVGALALALVMGVVLSLNYYYVIEHEEKKLPSIFGPAYEEYCRIVPRFFPQMTRPPQEALEKVNPDLQIYEFSSDLAHENKALEAVWSFFGLIVGCALLVWIKANLGWIN